MVEASKERASLWEDIVCGNTEGMNDCEFR
jgi:hypothetical protein